VQLESCRWLTENRFAQFVIVRHIAPNSLVAVREEFFTRDKMTVSQVCLLSLGVAWNLR
jgi:hypothetical protein